MIKTLSLSMAILAASLLSQTTTAQSLVIIGSSGTFAKGTLPKSGSWLALICEGKLCELKQVQPHISHSTEKNILEEDEPTDVIETELSAVALISDSPLTPRKLIASFIESGEAYNSLQSTSLLRLGRWNIPSESFPLTLYWVKLPEYGGYRYHVTDGHKKQFIFRTELEGHYGGAIFPIIHWAGDLNGDEKPDFLLSIPDDNCGFDMRLYLSSSSQEKLVTLAARLEGREPACGC